MLELSYIRAHKSLVVSGLERKCLQGAADMVEEVLALDQERRTLQTARDKVLADSNAQAKEIGRLMKAGDRESAQACKAKAATLKEDAKQLRHKVAELEEQVLQMLYRFPNLPHLRVPEGKGASDNVTVDEGGSAPTFDFEPLPHWELCQKHDLVDFETGNKVTGGGFPFYKGKGARLQRAMINFFLDQATASGYQEVQPPILVNEASGYGTGQLPDKEGQMYELTEPKYYLIPTAEVPLTNMYRDQILDTQALPIKMVAYTPCFRTEAGSWGAHVRGLNRLHQFDKVELVQICLPQNSYQVLDQMCDYVCTLLQKLALPYRKLLLCGGDLSFNAALCFDMEVYSAAQKRWLEVSSVSNFESYQANRLKLRYRKDQKKTALLHTLNGSALALPRILAALLENNQTQDGHIRIPEVLQDYCGFTQI